MTRPLELRERSTPARAFAYTPPMTNRTKDLAVGCFVGVMASVSCAGITSTVETLRARRIHLVDESDQLQVDVGAELASLRTRVERLEAAAAKP